MNIGQKKRLLKMVTAAGMAAALGTVITSYGAESTDWKQDYEAAQSVIQTERMEQGKPVHPMEQAVLTPDAVAIDGAEAAGEVVVRDENGDILGTYSGNTMEEELKKYESSVIVKTSSTAETLDSDEVTGPGAVSKNLEVEDKTEEVGPKVEEVVLEESYHEEFELYSESLEGRYFIYSNVGNNGMTDQPVYLDIPQNVTYTAEKDGLPFSYTAKQNVSDMGTYVFYFTAVKDPSKPLSRQVIYETSFNFRIQPKPAGKDKESAAGQASSGYDFVSPQYGLQNTEETTEEIAEEITEGNTEETTEGTTLDTENKNVMEPTSEPEEEMAGETAENVNAGNTGSYDESYNRETGFYKIALQENKYFQSGVPNGMLSNLPVIMDFAGMGKEEETITVYRDGQLYVMPENNTFAEAGSYTFLLTAGTENYVYSFKVLGEAQADLDSYTVPAMMTVTSLKKDGLDVAMDEEYRLDFTEDGIYDLQMANEEGVISGLSFTIDHQPPEFDITVQNHMAMLSLQSADIADIEVTVNGNTEHYTELYQLSAPGRYTVKVSDNAGNYSTKSVTLTKKFNPAGLIAVVIIIGMIVTAAFFIKRTKKNFNVK